MRKLAILSAALAGTFAALVPATPARAVFTQTFVKSDGNDANDCSRPRPCATFTRAISQTFAAGVVSCLDSGPYGFDVIAGSVTIDCAGGVVMAFAGQNALTINGAGIVVILRNMTIDSSNPSTPGAIGINVLQAASVHIENCTIRGFTSNAAQGIRIDPTSGFTTVSIVDTVISDNGLGVFALGAQGVLVKLDRVQMNSNLFGGFRASGANGAVFANVVDSAADLNGTHGFVASSPAGGQAVVLDIQRSGASLNQQDGILADGAGASITIGASRVIANTTGLARTNGGAILSYGDNRVDNNSTNGSPSGMVGTM